MKSHPVSVFQAIAKAVGSQTLRFYSAGNIDVPVFHMREKKHSYKMKPFDRLFVEFLFFKRSFEEVEQWRRNLLLYFPDPAYVESVEILTVGEIDGYEYMMEWDIEDFSPSIELRELYRLLEHYLPLKDI